MLATAIIVVPQGVNQIWFGTKKKSTWFVEVVTYKGKAQ